MTVMAGPLFESVWKAGFGTLFGIPASIPVFVFLSLLGHQIGLFFQRTLVRPTDLMLAALGLQTVIAVTCSSLFELLDQQYRAGRLSQIISNCRVKNFPPVSFITMLKQVLQNHIIAMVLVYLLFPYSQPHVYKLNTETFLDSNSFSATIINVFLYIVLFDVAFYVLHRLLHVRLLNRFSHKLHHQTHANSGISFHYMDLLDFVFENPLPCLIPVYIAGLHVPAFFIFVVVGVFNSVVVHSGWQFPYFPDISTHLRHHTSQQYNYGIGLLDRICGTSAPQRAPRVQHSIS